MASRVRRVNSAVNDVGEDIQNAVEGYLHVVVFEASNNGVVRIGRSRRWNQIYETA